MILHYQPKNRESHKRTGEKLWALEADEDGYGYLIKIEKNFPIRSLDANKYYRVVLKIIAIHTGSIEDDLHEEYKIMFSFREKEIDGKVMRVPISTTKMNVKQFAIYTQRVKDHARDFHGCVIPEKKDMNYLVWSSINQQYERHIENFG